MLTLRQYLMSSVAILPKRYDPSRRRGWKIVGFDGFGNAVTETIEEGASGSMRFSYVSHMEGPV